MGPRKCLGIYDGHDWEESGRACGAGTTGSVGLRGWLDMCYLLFIGPYRWTVSVLRWVYKFAALAAGAFL